MNAPKIEQNYIRRMKIKVRIILNIILLFIKRIKGKIMLNSFDC
jgi:hypothetical protein